ncbi:hypothetical protein GQ457_15G020750 [Hibiscus cannabinus]
MATNATKMNLSLTIIRVKRKINEGWGLKMIGHSGDQTEDEYRYPKPYLDLKLSLEYQYSGMGTGTSSSSISTEGVYQYRIEFWSHEYWYPISSTGTSGSWNDGCRPFIGDNGGFLETFIQGELLVALSRDGNNQMFPVAWAIVEGKGKESWKWFLTKLMQDLNHPDGEGLTLLSNQQKIQFWNCVRWAFVEDFDDQLKILEEMGVTSTNDLLVIPLLHWSRAYFTGTFKCDVVNNNLVEGFNGWILDARLKKIRKMVMQKMHVKKSWISKWKTNIAPRAQQELEKNMELSTPC